MKHDDDPRVVLTLDAGGTNLKFSAIRGNRLLFAPLYIPSEAHDLSRCLANIVAGFRAAEEQSPTPPVAISFAFPGPADYPAGIIGDLPNLPAFRGGVAVGPMLEEVFGLPVFINNDGNLFAYGEAMSGFLPYVNGLLEEAGQARRHRNLFGVTLGTGLGGGAVVNGGLLVGDTSNGGEAYLMRHKLDPANNAEEGACIRAVRREYARGAGLPAEEAPDPKVIAEIARGEAPGDRAAAVESYRRLGEVVGDALAQALNVVDGVAVIGGGLAGAHALFLPAVVEAMRDVYHKPDGVLQNRLVARAYNVEDPVQRQEFTVGHAHTIRVPGSDRELVYDPTIRTAVGISRLGTSEAVAIGAYAFALAQLD